LPPASHSRPVVSQPNFEQYPPPGQPAMQAPSASHCELRSHGVPAAPPPEGWSQRKVIALQVAIEALSYVRRSTAIIMGMGASIVPSMFVSAR
jgi:hypothetical protein